MTLPAGLWEDALPEGTPLPPLAPGLQRELHPPDDEKRRLRALTDYLEGDVVDPTVELRIAALPAAEPVAQPQPTPDLMTILKPREEPRMDATGTETQTTPETPDAPFGYKADGTPRKRPAPTRDQIQAAAAGRRAAALARNAASASPKSEPATTVGSPFLAQMLESLDAEIARLELARTKIREALAS